VHLMNQNIRSTDAVSFATLNTGFGANELYDMNQHVLSSSAPTFAGITLNGNINLNNREMDNINYLDIRGGVGYGIRFWSSSSYRISMGNVAEYKYGPVTDYSIKSHMNGTAGRGWTWGIDGSIPVASIGNTGNMQIAGNLYAIGGIHVGGTSAPGTDDLIVDGQASIGTTTVANTLVVKTASASKAIRLEHGTLTTEYWTIGVGSGSYDYRFGYKGTLVGQINKTTGTYTATSDFRLKESIHSLGNVLAKVEKLKPSKYYFKRDREKRNKSLGFIAQEVQELFPEIVYQLENGYLGLAYDNFSVIAIKAIQEQQLIIKKMETRIKILENK